MPVPFRPQLKPSERSPDVREMGWLARMAQDPERYAKRVEPLRFAPVEVQVIGRASVDVLHARNVSTTGISIYVPHGFAGFDLATEVELVVTLPGAKPFLARGLIKHLTAESDTQNHFGLHFLDLGETNRRSIESYVRSRRT